MKAPGDIEALAKLAKESTTELTNEEMMQVAGGANPDWGAYLLGARIGSLVHRVNKPLAELNLCLSSQGMGTRLWRVVTVAEANKRCVEFRLAHADSNIKNAYCALAAIADDVRATKKQRDNARAWLELYSEPTVIKALDTMRVFALELLADVKRQDL